MKTVRFLLLLSSLLIVHPNCLPAYTEPARSSNPDIAIYGATPAGIAAAIAAARLGSSVEIYERHYWIGGMIANGLGATDIKNRGAVGGIFREFVTNIREYYTETYGAGSAQARAANDGYYFEPNVAEKVWKKMLGEHPNIKVVPNAQLIRVYKKGSSLVGMTLMDRTGGPEYNINAKVFLDATYEGDLAAMAGVPYRVGREARSEYGEPYAGVLYWGYRDKQYLDDLSTGEGDDRVMAYNYRLCLTNVPENRTTINQPPGYNRFEYMILSRQVRLGQVKSFKEAVHIVPMPNGKSDTNNHTIPLLSTNLPVENYPYPEADWEWRDAFAKRLRNYIIGLLYFCQNDTSLPESFRNEAREWGFAKDEYIDNDNFPRQIYVRAARRIEGEYTFSAHDVMVIPGKHRTRIHADSIGGGSYEMDSHSTRKYEPGIPYLEGLLGVWQYSYVYQVPFRVMIPKRVENLLVPGAVSATHMGFSTLRMEPCWMAMGQAAGTAASLSIAAGIPVRKANIEKLQRQLLADDAVIMYFDDITWDTPNRQAVQFFGARGVLDGYRSGHDLHLDRGTAALWLDMTRHMGYWNKRREGPAEPFVDVPGDHPGFRAIGALAERGMFAREKADGEFRPYESLTPNQLREWFQQAGIELDISSVASQGWVRRGQFLNFMYVLGEK